MIKFIYLIITVTFFSIATTAVSFPLTARPVRPAVLTAWKAYSNKNKYIRIDDILYRLGSIFPGERK